MRSVAETRARLAGVRGMVGTRLAPDPDADEGRGAASTSALHRQQEDTAYGDLRDHLVASRQSLDAIARALQDNSGRPRVLETRTITIPAAGYVERSFRVPYAAAAVFNLTSAQLTVASAGAQNSAPANGQGIVLIPASRFLAFNLAGQTFTIYGPAGGQVCYTVYLDHIQPAAGLAPGTWTLFGQQPTGASLQVDGSTYTLGVQFSFSRAGVLKAIWFNSAAGATDLPITIALFAVSGRSLVTSQAASWTGPGPGGGWNRAAFTSPPALTPGASYKAAVLHTNAINWYSATNHYWDTGPGQSGLASGPLLAPNNGGGDFGQGTFHNAAVLTYPDTSFNATNYWLDPEVFG